MEAGAVRSGRKAREKRGPGTVAKTRQAKPRIPATTAPEADKRATADRRLPGFDPDGLTALGLTRREMAVLELVAEGRTNEAIAASLKLSPLTVKKHLERMSTKLGARSRAALVALTWLRSRSRGTASGRVERGRREP